MATVRHPKSAAIILRTQADALAATMTELVPIPRTHRDQIISIRSAISRAVVVAVRDELCNLLAPHSVACNCVRCEGKRIGDYDDECMEVTS